ncbi:MAG TPA: hypothetical protein VNK04_24265 [Gemmataceae bacterium]|nr:hypothetical protein [Gemmataceae bacterium]
MRGLASLTLSLGILALGMLSGCGDPRNRQEVTGEVTLKGQPVDDGIILFAPVDGQETGDGAQIVNGKYRIPKEKGLSPGKYRVSIYAGDGRSGAGDASPDSPYAGSRPGKERIPPQYNEKSKIIKEVTPGGPNKFDFDIP